MNFANIMVTPFLTSVALDAGITGIDMWAGRELLLNLGRSLGSALILVTYSRLHDYRPVFLVLGSCLVLYAVVLHAKRIYPSAKIVPSQPAR